MRIHFDNRYVVAVDAPSDVIQRWADATSYLVEGRQHVAAFKKGYWDGRERLVKARPRKVGGGHKAPIGLLQWLLDICDDEGVEPELFDERRALHDDIEINWNPMWALRYYQQDAVDAVLMDRGPATGKGCLKLPTRSGKTVIAAGLIDAVRKPTLFLAASELLTAQTHALFEDVLGVKIGYIGGGTWEESDITVASPQTLMRYMGPPERKKRADRLKVRKVWSELGEYDSEALLEQVLAKALKKLKGGLYEPQYKVEQTTKGKWRAVLKRGKLDEDAWEVTIQKHERCNALLESTDMVFFDECHHLEGEGWRELFELVNARYKIGLSATIWDETTDKGHSLSDIWIRAVTGPILHERDVNDMIREGFLVKPHFRFIPIERPKVKGDYHKARSLGIVKHPTRNAKIVEEAKYWSKMAGKRVLIVVKEVAHARHLKPMLEDAGLTVAQVTGPTSSKRRQTLIGQFATGTLDVLLGTVFGEGVDIPVIDVVINAEGGASRQSGFQRLRNLTPAPGKTEAITVEFVDLHNSYLAKHSLARLRLYREQDQFIAKVVK